MSTPLPIHPNLAEPGAHTQVSTRRSRRASRVLRAGLYAPRRGEALGLRWDAVDLHAGTVTFCHQRSTAGGSVVEGPPKTSAGARTIALDATMIPALRAWRRQCN